MSRGAGIIVLARLLPLACRRAPHVHPCTEYESEGAILEPDDEPEGIDGGNCPCEIYGLI